MGRNCIQTARSVYPKNRDATDIFCFQEVHDHEVGPANDPRERGNLFEELRELLPRHKGYLARKASGSCLATFVAKSFKVASTQTFTVLSPEEMAIKFTPRILQHVALVGPQLNIYNFHGVPKLDKLDTPERKIQTERVLEIMAKSNDPKILVGDLNLRPETESLKAFEKQMTNLVIERGFKTTRSSYYDLQKLQPFADYVFTSKDIKVKDFQVLPNEISDHLPLLLDFE